MALQEISVIFTHRPSAFSAAVLLLTLVLCRGSFVVDVTQSCYQAEENHNITLEWTFTTKPDMSISALRILCYMKTDHKDSTLYYLFDGVEFSKHQDEKFSGRVQSDKDALREGRIRLQLSRLRTEDSGLYLCEVDTGYGRGSNSCRVTVSEFFLALWLAIVVAVYICISLVSWGFIVYQNCKEPKTDLLI
ncbi:uncharacterized protein LOC100702057 isoform X2 [Oreochromis niloticus]|uniref:uncharacterized protein LOC100702057 isoform X2 n=1 Tax=Oreochromis niloticus TaxID=8128 RepID=UPI000674D9D4|nr:uncharacterized protein LOC100702057 isoform X2 [Oreochromis niloticus]